MTTNLPHFGERCWLDEDRHIELKMHPKIALKEIPMRCQKVENGHVVRTLQPISKTICAFLNTEGGVIYVGVGDDKGIYGRMLTDDMKDHFLAAVYSCISQYDPPVPADCIKVGFVEMGGYNGDQNTDTSVYEPTPEQCLNSEDFSEDDYTKSMDEFQQLVPKKNVNYHVIGKMKCPCMCNQVEEDQKLYLIIIKVIKPPGDTIYQNEEGLPYYRRNGSNKLITLNKMNALINTDRIVKIKISWHGKEANIRNVQDISTPFACNMLSIRQLST